MANHAFPYSLTTLAAAIAGALLSSAAAADTTLYCPAANGMISCTYTGTNYSEPVGIMRNNTGSAYSAPMYVTTNFDVNATIVPESQAGLWIEAMAGTGTFNSPNDGNNADGLTPNTSGNITLTGGDIVTNGAIYGLLAKMNGGNATTSDGGDVGGNGGVAGAQEILYLANQANIDMTGLAQTQIQGGAGIAVLSKGGNGASTNDDHNPSGAGGYSSGSRLKNVGQVSATVQGSTRFSGLQAASNGGEGATQYDGGANSGGDSGDVSLQNSGNIVVDWTWRNGNTASNSNAAVYGILAESHGGNGGDTTTDGLGNGGAGGYASSAVITLETGGSVRVMQRGTPPNTVQGSQIFPGAGVAAILLGGDGGNGYADEDQTSGGNAGDAGTIGSSSPSLQIINTDTSVSTSGDPSAGSFSPSGDKLPALLLWAKGGEGAGLFNDDPHYSRRDGGNGGIAGDASLTVTAQNAAITLSTNGNYSSGIQTRQQGGAGGAGGQYNGDTLGLGDTHPSGIGGAGGQAGGSTISLTGTSALPIAITTQGQESHGIYASLLGGDGGAGGIYDVNVGGQIAGTAGAGGSTGNMKITLKGTSISTVGSQAFGILAQSRGANGGDGGEATGDDVTGGAGGAGGSTGTVDVSLDANSSISTQGQSAIGILAQTASGAGGDGGGATGEGSSTGGAGGSGGNSGDITVNNAGQIATRGVDAIGILAQSVTGAGGAGAESYGILDSSGGSGGSAGVTGTLTVSNSGQISTSGDMAIGVVMQSIGGSGGTGGTASGLLVALGGSSASNTLRSDGSSVRINGSASGSVTTSGAGAIGILAQTIGGGGGVGGGSEGAVSIGATGGEGGSGAVATADLDSFLISTGGMNAHGLVIQSIGGGGGNAGNAGSLGVFASVAIGQAGGRGGSGGAVTANLSNSKVITQSSKAAGIVAQSIGGGGGTGGRAFATSVGVGADGDVAIGGSGGLGGHGGQIGSQLVGSYIATGQATQLTTGACSGTCLPSNQLPVDAFGVVIQSIGGGGGLGGNASSSAIATGLDVSEDAQIALSMTASIGGSGKIGGNGDYVTFAASDGTQITTSGQGSHGVLIQSIG
ncbi:beta strand repeat-containing protein, partial [Bordetella tumbae]|uniref:beta strand repeat-containing protein n=1 Tax=Bordetella tumbae TaxID=1649139 RepID=UPI0039EEA325